MTKETMINILNQHGLDVLYDVISDVINNTQYYSYKHGYNEGYSQGRFDWNNTMKVIYDIENKYE